MMGLWIWMGVLELEHIVFHQLDLGDHLLQMSIMGLGRLDHLAADWLLYRRWS